jgi:hypothetical protein
MVAEVVTVGLNLQLRLNDGCHARSRTAELTRKTRAFFMPTLFEERDENFLASWSILQHCFDNNPSTALQHLILLFSSRTLSACVVVGTLYTARRHCKTQRHVSAKRGVFCFSKIPSKDFRNYHDVETSSSSDSTNHCSTIR